jgi:site-specific DNA recombinase
MQVAMYARVSSQQQQRDGTIQSQVALVKTYIQQQGWTLLAEHEYIDDGFSGARLDRPALDRLRDGAQRGEFEAVVMLSPDRLARHYAHQWFLIEELQKWQVQGIFLHNPFGDTPQGKLLVQMQGMMAEYERAQISERTRRGRLEKARRGEYIPWAFRCYGYRYLAKRHDQSPQVVIEESEAQVVRQMFGWLIEDQLSSRQITKQLNERGIPTPTGQNAVWTQSTVHGILTNEVYAGQARYNQRQAVAPRSRRKPASALASLKTSRRPRPETEWVRSQAPAIISSEGFDKAQDQLRRNAAMAKKMYQPGSRRYLLRRLVCCGHCNLGMAGICQRPRRGRRFEYLYYECRGRSPLNAGRLWRCPSPRVRADVLDEVVWEAVAHLLRQPERLPLLYEQWREAQQVNLSQVTAQQQHLQKRRQQVQRQDQRLVDAYQQEVISLTELQSRRQKLASQLKHLEDEAQRLARQQQQVIHWQRVMANLEQFRAVLGQNLERLSFEDRQAVAQCLIDKVVVMGEEVDIYCVLPFDAPPQVCHNASSMLEETSDRFYRLRLTHRP